MSAKGTGRLRPLIFKAYRDSGSKVLRKSEVVAAIIPTDVPRQKDAFGTPASIEQELYVMKKEGLFIVLEKGVYTLTTKGKREMEADARRIAAESGEQPPAPPVDNRHTAPDAALAAVCRDDIDVLILGMLRAVGSTVPRLRTALKEEGHVLTGDAVRGRLTRFAKLRAVENRGEGLWVLSETFHMATAPAGAAAREGAATAPSAPRSTGGRRPTDYTPVHALIVDFLGKSPADATAIAAMLGEHGLPGTVEYARRRMQVLCDEGQATRLTDGRFGLIANGQPAAGPNLVVGTLTLTPLQRRAFTMLYQAAGTSLGEESEDVAVALEIDDPLRIAEGAIGDIGEAEELLERMRAIGLIAWCSGDDCWHGKAVLSMPGTHIRLLDEPEEKYRVQINQARLQSRVRRLRASSLLQENAELEDRMVQNRRAVEELRRQADAFDAEMRQLKQLSSRMAPLAMLTVAEVRRALAFEQPEAAATPDADAHSQNGYLGGAGQGQSVDGEFSTAGTDDGSAAG
jgi:hypothetical protein